MSREHQLARLCRALIACCAFLFAFEAPMLPAWSERDASAWLAERTAASRTAAPRTVAPRVAAPRVVSSALAATSPSAKPEANASRLDRRYLFLEIQTLLC